MNPVRPADHYRVMWLVALAMLACGALTVVAVTFLPDTDTSDHAALRIIAVGMASLACLLAAAGPRPRLLRPTPIAGVLLIGTLIAVARPLGMFPLFYLWPTLFAAYFLSRAWLIAVAASMVVTFAVALAFSPSGLRAATFVAVVVCTSVAATVVERMRARLMTLVTELDGAAHTDPLTGLLNRRAFEEHFDREVAVADRYDRPLTVAMLDLDHFKVVNDQFGHARGDEVLRQFAALLEAECRESDIVARLGGEEFAVLFTHTSEPEAHHLAERIAQQLRRAADDGPQLSVSVGLAEVGRGLAHREALMGAADEALYEAKAAGRHRVASHGGVMTVTA